MRGIALVAAAFALVILTLPARATERRAGEIVFERRSGTGVGELYVVRADGGRLRKLVGGRGNFDPAWSPDGARVVFASDRSGGSGAHELFVADADGRRVRPLTRRVAAGGSWTADSAPAWSPDGAWIAFVRLEVRGSSSRTDLWLVRPDGAGQRRLARTPWAEAAPSWSGPRRLVYERRGTIYAVSLTRSGARAGEPRRIRRGGEPAVAPRGDGIAFVRGGGVYASIAGSAVRVGTGSAPAWAPNGSRIVYATERGLVSVRPDGTGRLRITRAPGLAHDLGPAWRPGATLR